MKFVHNLVSQLISGHRLPALILIIFGTTMGLGKMHFNPLGDDSAFRSPALGHRMNPGPWGELYSVPITLSAPEELLPIRTIEADHVRWVFKNYTVSELAHLFHSMDLPDDVQNALLDPPVVHESPGTIELTPRSETVLAVPMEKRREIYRLLAQFPENRAMFTVLNKSTMDERFAGSGVDPETLALYRELSFERGDYLVLGDLPLLLSHLSSYEEKVHFLKAMTSQKTMLIQLRIGKDSDLNSLTAYWGHGYRAANTRSLLDAVQRVPGGTTTNLVTLLPPEPASHLNNYPIVPPAAQQAGTALARDCHWTSLNFFRETGAEENCVTADTLSQELTDHYFPIANDPRYGDILVLATPDGTIVHSAVFIADDVVYTKNGASDVYPWIFSTIPDVLKEYSYIAPEGQQLALRYFRSKEL